MSTNKIMAAQDGVITREQAITAGLSSSAVSRRLLSGEWTALRAGIYLREDRERTPEVELRSAVYSSGGCAHGPSAAWWHGLLDKPPRQHSVTVPLSRSVTCAGVRVRRRDLDRRDIDNRRSLLVTSLPLSVLEAAVSIERGAELMDRALQRHTSLPALQAAHRRNLGRTGSAAAARLLKAAGDGGESEAERILHRLLRLHRISGWTPQYRSCGYVIDVAFVAHGLAIEVDGWAWHGNVDRFNSDAHRQNILVNAGWHVLRFTWHQLTRTPEVVVTQIAQALNGSPR
ncbi:hypothetical protein B2J88_08370 [Rhodococcus sp. SRB_17]|nr:hypothetical protein [Rhodococcus sp. SRB_17]